MADKIRWTFFFADKETAHQDFDNLDHHEFVETQIVDCAKVIYLPGDNPLYVNFANCKCAIRTIVKEVPVEVIEG